MSLNIGDFAPEFILMDQHNKEFKISKFKGKKILLSFHPLAWTSVCKKQMKSIESNYDKFKANNTITLGISVDPIPTKHAWAKEIGLKKLRILSDFWPHGNVAKLYGIFRQVEGFSERANIIIDEKGKISFLKIYNLPELPDIDEIIDVISS